MDLKIEEKNILYLRFQVNTANEFIELMNDLPTGPTRIEIMHDLNFTDCELKSFDLSEHKAPLMIVGMDNKKKNLIDFLMGNNRDYIKLYGLKLEDGEEAVFKNVSSEFSIENIDFCNVKINANNAHLIASNCGAFGSISLLRTQVNGEIIGDSSAALIDSENSILMLNCTVNALICGRYDCTSAVTTRNCKRLVISDVRFSNDVVIDGQFVKPDRVIMGNKGDSMNMYIENFESASSNYKKIPDKAKVLKR